MKTYREFITELTGKGKLYDIERDSRHRAAMSTYGMPGRKSQKPGAIRAHVAADHHNLKASVAKSLSRASERRGYTNKHDPDDSPSGRLEGMKKVMAKYRASRESSRSARQRTFSDEK